MARTLSITEPHPSVSQTGGYIGGGRGGAGNYYRYASSELTAGPEASGPASRISLARSSHQRSGAIPAGRGGAGNMHRRSPSPADDEAIFQFDEELLRARAAAPVYHIGRGGAANWVDAHATRAPDAPLNAHAPRPERAPRTGSTASADSRASSSSAVSIAQRILSAVGRRHS